MSDIYAFVTRDYDEDKATMDYINSTQFNEDQQELFPEEEQEEPQHFAAYYPPGFLSNQPGYYPGEQQHEKAFVKKLINDHWNYIEGVLVKSDITGCRSPNSIKEIEFHYKTAFEHGWKHAMEYVNDADY